MNKIKLFLFSIALSAIVLPTFSQVGIKRNDLSIGFNGGYCMNTMTFQPTIRQNMHTGFTGGISMRYVCEKYFNSICAILLELNYVQMGWNEDIITSEHLPVINEETGLAEKYQRNINYLQLPILARMGWGQERKGFQFFFQAGPQLGYCINESTDKNFTTPSSTRSSTVTTQYDMPIENKIDYGISGGFGLEYSIPKAGHLLLEGRYYYGLGDIYGNSKKDYFGRSANSTIYIKMTYLFDLVKTKGL